MEPADGGGARARRDPEGRALHARLLRGDPTAPSDLAVGYLEPLVARLRRAYPLQDDDVVFEVACDLILTFSQQPETYDPDQLALPAYLLMAAKRDVLNVIERDQRRQLRIVPLESVELRPLARNKGYAAAQDPADTVEDAVDDEAVATALASLGDTDREVVQMLMDGERRNERFAAVLGLQDRPLSEQRREVKRTKDRLKKRLQRSRLRVTDDA